MIENYTNAFHRPSKPKGAQLFNSVLCLTKVRENPYNSFHGDPPHWLTVPVRRGNECAGCRISPNEEKESGTKSEGRVWCRRVAADPPARTIFEHEELLRGPRLPSVRGSPARLSHDFNIFRMNFTDGAGRGRYLPRKQMEKGLAGLAVTRPTVSLGSCQRKEGVSNDTINNTRVYAHHVS
jgi:hypothetical protein